MEKIHKVAVVGAGVMGSGIAAQLANADVEVVLLDQTKQLAESGSARQDKANGFMDVAFAKRITTGSITTDLHLVSDADWIIEAVAERLDVKQALYKAINGVRKRGSIVSSNTSTIPLAALTQDLSDGLAADFLITHFFNPPRIMRLLEIVGGPKTRPEAIAAICNFADHDLGKQVVLCKDTPGFIGNRIGNFWMLVAQNEAIRLGLDVEEADAIIGAPFGIPSTGIFGLLDLVGIDLMATILRSLQDALPETDAFQEYEAAPALVTRMIAENRIGRKAGAGYVRYSSERKNNDITDLLSGDYRPIKPVASTSLDASRGNLRALMEHGARGGQYAGIVMEKTLVYAASLVPEIADGPDAIDEAMRTGYGWKEGPFELIDRLDPIWLGERITARGLAKPPYLELAAKQGSFYSTVEGRRCCLLPDGSVRHVDRAEGIITIADLSLAAKPSVDYGCAALWDLGDGVACFEFRTKMNTFSDKLLDALNAALEEVERRFKALVIGSAAPLFSVGADLRVFLEKYENGGNAALRAFIFKGHSTFKAVKYARFPIVGAAAGLAVGGGCELLLHCHAIQAHAELSMGLVEARVGVVPGWGGCKELLIRLQDPSQAAINAFHLIASSKVSTSAFEAKKLGFLREQDGITMNRARLIADAKNRALQLAPEYMPPEAPFVQPAGRFDVLRMRDLISTIATDATDHDLVVAEALITVLSGDERVQPLSESAIVALECDAFVTLFQTPATRDRVRHMLATGKPLRN